MRFSSAQEAAVAPYVRGQRVLDLGAADLSLSHVMLAMGAQDVLAVDRHAMPERDTTRIQTKVCHFHDLVVTRPVILASWIVNWSTGIEPLLHAAPHIVSISKNTDGSSCGYPSMWRLLSKREVLEYLPDPKNVVIVYGPQHVERAPYSRIGPFADLHFRRS